MGYSNPEYQTRQLVNIGMITGTATASGTNALTGGDLKFTPPKFVRKTKINTVRFESAIATPANWTGLVFKVLNGTSTVGTSTASGTAQQVLTPTLTAALCTFAADANPTFEINGTSTASGQSLGTYNIFAEVQELYA